VPPILIAICLTAQPGEQFVIDFFEKRTASISLSPNSADS